MSRKVTVLGSTGSIGRQSLEVIAACGMETAALAANSSVKLMEEQARQYRPSVAALADETPLGRVGTPEEAAAAITFLASDEASFLTGQVVAPNGGLVV